MTKTIYKPVSVMAGLAAGSLAGLIFKQVWRLTAGEPDAPQATDARRGWREILLAAALQGAITGLVKAAVDRGAAAGTHKLTGFWPGEGARSGEDRPR